MPNSSGALPLGLGDLAIACALVLVAAVISLALQLQLERRLGLAALRTLVQLLLVGYLLEWVFSIDSPFVVLIAFGVMTFAASVAAVGRSSRRYPEAYWHSFVTLVLTATLTTFTVTEVVIGVEPWYKPQYVLVLLGMVLGNSLTGISLCLDTLLETLSERAELVEMELALGASRWEAARDPLRDAVRRGMIPIINSMMVVGLVSLPGMMTGQILQGASPLDAVKYQVVVMFMLAASTALGCIVVALLVFRRLFNDRHQLRSERIRRGSS